MHTLRRFDLSNIYVAYIAYHSQDATELPLVRSDPVTGDVSFRGVSSEPAKMFAISQPCSTRPELSLQARRPLLRQPLVCHALILVLLSVATFSNPVLARVTAIVEGVEVEGDNFAEQIRHYWLLKRRSRRGVPLLRRLQV